MRGSGEAAGAGGGSLPRVCLALCAQPWTRGAPPQVLAFDFDTLTLRLGKLAPVSKAVTVTVQ